VPRVRGEDLPRARRGENPTGAVDPACEPAGVARRLARGIVGAGRILAAAGAREIFTAHARHQRWDEGFPSGAFAFGPGRGSLYSFHLMGSARMGASATSSAVRPIGDTWEVEDLVVADGSAFPTASGVNPMITIEAIAHLNASALAARLG
jgi:choline dehydrogenase-like flavoprotein